jgi:2-deoxy-D-gluconate 3-dehydrogenase
MFAQKEAVVYMLDINEANLLKAAKNIKNAIPLVCDISNEKSIRIAFDKIIKNNVIDILVNSAGIGTIEKAENFAIEDWRKVIEINLNSTFFVSQIAGREMIKAKHGGKIISIASQAGLVAIDKHVAYSASKAGLISMTKSLAYEWGKFGIQVNAISPTATETPLIQGYWDQEEIKKEALENTPAGRYCKPEEVAALALFLASESSNMITGANILIDGGYTIH